MSVCCTMAWFTPARARQSYMHNVPRGSETHFKVVLVSEAFDGLSLIKRHRAVNSTLKVRAVRHPIIQLPMARRVLQFRVLCGAVQREGASY